jgi:hypothetical protein
MPTTAAFNNDSMFGPEVRSESNVSRHSTAGPVSRRRVSQQYSGGAGFDDDGFNAPLAAVNNSAAQDVDLRDHDVPRLDADSIPAATAPLVDPASRVARQFLEASDQVFVKVEAVHNVPLSVGCSEVTIAFAEPRGRAIVTVPELPSARKAQDEAAVSSSPTFTSCAITALVKPKIQALFTVTCLDHRTKQCGVLGHALVSLWNKRGVFEVRLREGRPNNDLSSTLNDSASTLPLTSITVHINVRPGEAREATVRMFDFTHQEEQLLSDRQGRANATAQTYGLTAVHCEKSFRDYHHQRAAAGDATVLAAQQTAPPKERPLDLSNYAPFNEKRGAALVVHGLYYCIAQDRSPLQLFKVVVEVDGRRGFTQFHDWSADAFRPKFLDAIFTFSGLRMRQNLACIVRVYRMKFNVDAAAVAEGAPPVSSFREVGHWKLEEYGWGAVGMASQLGQGVLRHAATLPVRLYQGSAPSGLADAIGQRNTVEEALSLMMERGEIQLHRKTVGNQAPLLTVSVADPARLTEVTMERSSSTAPAKAVLAEEFKRYWPKPSQVQSDSNAYFKAALFTSSQGACL